MDDNKIYFASDFHLGTDHFGNSLEREKRIVRWLDEIKNDAAELYLVGDIFEFWFEYKRAVPKGFVRLLGKLAEISDSGIPIHYFTGNHDIWLNTYFQEELNFNVYFEPITREINGLKFYIGHGDALGPGDFGGKFVNGIMKNSLAKWLFGKIHPDLGIRLGYYFSQKSGVQSKRNGQAYFGDDKEALVLHSKSILEKEHVDFFIFGHRHLALDMKLNETSRYVDLGDWITINSYGVLDGKNFELKYFEQEVPVV